MSHNYAGNTNGTLEAALAYVNAGLCVIPIHANGSKAPQLGTWKEFEKRRPNDSEIKKWFSNDNNREVGIGLVGGRVSGDLLQLDIDLDSIIIAFEELLKDAGHGDLLQKLHKVRSPRGAHYRARVPGVRLLTLQLAWHSPDGLECPQKVLIETRNEGACAIVPPSPASCHPSGLLYTTERGDLTCLQTITEAELQVLYNIAQLFGEPRRHKQIKASKPIEYPKNAGERPGDIWAAQTSWRDFLEPLGFVHVQTTGSGDCWRRPGKTTGTSAITGGNNDHLWVFSTSTDFEACRSYTKFGAYAHLNHAGDCHAAAAELRGRGYYTQAQPNLASGCKIPDPATASRLQSKNQVQTSKSNAENSPEQHWPYVPAGMEQQFRGLPVEVTPVGLIISPQAKEGERQKILQRMMQISSQAQAWLRFAIGDAYNALPRDGRNERSNWVKKNFGEGQLQNIKNCGWVAGCWGAMRRNMGLPWSFFVETADRCFGITDQDELVALWLKGGQTVVTLRQIKKDRKKENGNSSDSKSVGSGAFLHTSEAGMSENVKHIINDLPDTAREDLRHLITRMGSEYVCQVLRQACEKVDAVDEPQSVVNPSVPESPLEGWNPEDELIAEEERETEGYEATEGIPLDDFPLVPRHDVVTQKLSDPPTGTINTSRNTGLSCRDEPGCEDSDEILRDASALLAPFQPLFAANEAGLLPDITIVLKPGTTISAPYAGVIETTCAALRRMAGLPIPPNQAIQERLAVLIAMRDILMPLITQPLPGPA